MLRKEHRKAFLIIKTGGAIAIPAHLTSGTFLCSFSSYPLTKKSSPLIDAVFVRLANSPPLPNSAAIPLAL